jgi:methionine aminopeptidase
VTATIEMAWKIENEVRSLTEAASLERRRQIIREVDEKGIIATPANSYINELVVEAARLSILHDGDVVKIAYGDQPEISLRGSK